MNWMCIAKIVHTQCGARLFRCSLSSRFCCCCCCFFLLYLAWPGLAVPYTQWDYEEYSVVLYILTFCFYKYNVQYVLALACHSSIPININDSVVILRAFSAFISLALSVSLSLCIARALFPYHSFYFCSFNSFGEIITVLCAFAKRRTKQSNRTNQSTERAKNRINSQMAKEWNKKEDVKQMRELVNV